VSKVKDATGFSRVEIQLEPNLIAGKMIADTIGFSRMEIQFQPILEQNSPKLKLRRLKHGGI
jgi:hypothetical protein